MDQHPSEKRRRHTQFSLQQLLANCRAAAKEQHKWYRLLKCAALMDDESSAKAFACGNRDQIMILIRQCRGDVGIFDQIMCSSLVF